MFFTLQLLLPQPSNSALEFQTHEPNQSLQASAHHSEHNNQFKSTK